MRNPIFKIFVFILALTVGLGGVWSLRLTMFPPIAEIEDLTSHNFPLPAVDRDEVQPAKTDITKIKPCGAGNDFRWDKSLLSSETKAGGILNFDIKCGIFPEYPQAAKDKNISSPVIIGVLVDYDGRVIRAEAVKGHPLLTKPAIKAAYQTGFSPKLIGGKSYRIKGVLIYGFGPENPAGLQNYGVPGDPFHGNAFVSDEKIRLLNLLSKRPVSRGQD